MQINDLGPANGRKILLEPGFVATFLGLVVLPLLVGGAIYLGFRPRHLLMFSAADRMGLGGLVDAYRAGAYPLRGHLPPWAVYSLPNALWTLSLVAFLGLLWRHERAKAAYWMAAAAVLAIAPEFLQAVSLAPGTFSGGDVVSGVLACAAAALSVHFLPTFFSRDNDYPSQADPRRPTRHRLLRRAGSRLPGNTGSPDHPSDYPAPAIARGARNANDASIPRVDAVH